jgi:FkbM family methyltransferase
MLNSLNRAVTKLWLRKFRKKKMTPTVRAVFLGDNVSTHVILHGAYEKHELEALNKFVFSSLGRNTRCLDIGANIGNHTSFFSNFFERVYAFEPNPMVRAVLVANTIGRNITIYEDGLSDVNGTLYFQQDFVNLGGSRIVAEKQQSDFSINVKRLDDVAIENDLTNVTFVKMDVEGHEANVIRGGMSFLSAQKPIIAMEGFFLSDPSRGQEISSLLKEAGYRHFYKLTPRAEVVKVLENISPYFLRQLFLAILPNDFVKTLALQEINDILLDDHQLLICTHKALNLAT